MSQRTANMLGRSPDDGSAASGDAPTDDGVALGGLEPSFPGPFGTGASSENGDAPGAGGNGLQSVAGYAPPIAAGDNMVERRGIMPPTGSPAPGPGGSVAVLGQPDPPIPTWGDGTLSSAPTVLAPGTNAAGPTPWVGLGVPSDGGNATPAGGGPVSMVLSKPDPAIPVASFDDSETTTSTAAINTGPNGTGAGVAAAQADFSLGIAGTPLWLQQSGNGLGGSVMGTDGGATVAGRHSVQSQLQENATTAGARIDKEIAQVVQAMATYSVNPAFDATTTAQVANDPGLQGVIAAAWHH
jgi:hypothetical protein